MKLRLSPNLTAMLTAHGKTKAYLQRFKIIQSPKCVCKHGDQTTDHLLYDCEILGKEREKLIAYRSREEDWPVRKRELVNKHKTIYKFCQLYRLRKTTVKSELVNNYLKTKAQTTKNRKTTQQITI